MPSELQTIGDGAFESHALTSLVIPNGVISIGHRAFYGNALAKINLPVGLISIGWGAFENNQLTSLTIPNNVETIEGSAFSNNNISVLIFQSGCKLKEISGWCFTNNDIKNLAIPNSILQIDDHAFHFNQNLSNVTFGTNLLRIKRGAFSWCNLASITLPESLVFMGKYAFEDNENLLNIKLPLSSNNYKWNDSNGDKYNAGDIIIDKYYSYVALIEHVLDKDDIHVENGIITYCSYFEDITNVGSVITIPGNIDGQDIIGIGDGVFSDRGISEVILPEDLQTIGNGAFSNNEIINITLPNKLVSIGEWAFHDNCINTISFEATSQLETIGLYAFSSNRLINIDFPQSVLKIEKYAFAYNGLQYVIFEENSQLVSIGSRAFEGNWESLEITLPDLTVNPYEDYWVDWDNTKYTTNLVVTNFESFYKIPIEHTITEDELVVEDGVIVAYNPSNPLANILTLPDTYKGENILGIANGVFAQMGLIGVNLPSYLETISHWAFAENDILKVTIPRSIKEIGNDAFYQNSINEIIFENNSSLRHIGWSAFNNNRLESLTLPDSLNYVGGHAFGWNQIADGISIPDSVEYIGEYAFASNQIPTVTFTPNSILLFLGEYAFAWNTISNDIFIPLALTEISNYAFQSNNISKVISHERVVDYGTGAFQYNDPSLTITLHEPPTIPLVTYFFWWKDNYGNYYNPGEIISENSAELNFHNRYKAVIDQFFVVKFVVTDDNGQALENASIEIFGNTLTTDVNGIDSIGPVLRGLQDYKVSGITGCYDFEGSIDVQDDMTVLVTLIRYYNVKIKVVDINSNPITGASIFINDSTLFSNSGGDAKLSLPDGNYPTVVNVLGYKEYSDSLTILDIDTSFIVQLEPVLLNYNPNEGTGASYTDTSDGSDYIIDNNTFTRTAYTFSHWNINSDDSGTTYSENESITLGNSDIDLYAIWTPVDYNIIYHLDGGTNDVGNPAVYNTESEINLLPASKPSLYFATWLDTDSNRVARIKKGNTGDIELWAIFTPEPTYFIDYHNLENAIHNNQSTYTKFDLPFDFEDANKRGYEFIAWYEDSLFATQITAIPGGSMNDYDIYARWGGALEYSISYILEGGINNPSNPAKYTIESNGIIFEQPAKTGANFIAWYTDKDLITEITEIPKGTIGDTTIYAKWELDTFDIHYELDGGINNQANPAEYTIDSDQVVFVPPTRIGASFIAWYSDIDLITEIVQIPQGSIGDTILYAKWELNSYDIQYVLDGGSNNLANPAKYTIESENIAFEPPTKVGANFIAWYNDKDLLAEITEIQKGSIGDTTIYAKWELDTFDIQYELDGGINDSLNPAGYTIESSTINLENPDKTGFVFDGWYTSSNYTNSISSILNGSVGDLTIYAKWLEIFDVNFIITTDGINPAKDVNIVIDNTPKLNSDVLGLADTSMTDGSSFDYSIEINDIVIDNGFVTVSGSDVAVVVEIVDCYMRWFDVIFCDNGKGLWTDFVWYKDNNRVTGEQFYHESGGIEDGKYKLVVTSIAGVQYIWEKEYKTAKFEVNVYPNPVAKSGNLTINISEKFDLHNSKILIYNVTGSLIKTIDNPSHKNKISIDSKFSLGLYHIILLDNKNKRRDVKDFVVN